MSLNFHTAILAASRRRVSAFDPLSLTPALWLDASDADTLFDATSGGSTPTSGNDIARWEDKSGNDRHFTQATAAACPHYQTAVQNGLAIARFDGSNDVMNTIAGLNILRNKPGASVIACLRWRSNPTAAKTFFYAESGISNGLRFLTGAGSTSQKSRIASRNIDGSKFSTATSTANVPTTAMVHTATADYIGREAKIYINNAIEGTVTGAFGSSANTSNTDSLSVSLGGIAYASVQFCDIDLSEIFVFDRAISDADRNALHDYLVAKWGIT